MSDSPSSKIPPVERHGLWALRYAKLGWKMFPLKTRGDTHQPHQITSEGREKKNGGHHAGTDDRDQLKAWWKSFPSAGMGVNCAASGLVVVDVDPRKAGDKTLERLRKAFPGVLDSKVVTRTGGGGLHLYFLAEPGGRYPGTLGPGIDVKHNGYVITPPSVHRTGNRYEWLSDPFTNDIFLTTLSVADAQAMRDFGRSSSASPSTSSSRALVPTKPRAGEIEPDDDDDIFATLDDDRPLGYSDEQVRKIVFDVPNSGHEIIDDADEYVKAGARSYDDWLNVLFGIYHETNGSDEGMDIAREWSEQSAKFDENEFEKKWHSCRVDNKGVKPVTFRTVIKMSNDATREEREAKYEAICARLIEAENLDEVNAAVLDARTVALANPLHREEIAGQYRAAVKRLTKNVTISMAQARKDVRFLDPAITQAPEWCRDVCFVSAENVFLNYKDGQSTWTREAFDNTFMRDAMTEEDIRSGQARPSHAPSDLALTRYSVPIVWARGYVPWIKNAQRDPFYEREGRRFVNTYHARYAVKAPKEELTKAERRAVKLFQRFLARFVPDERERAILLSWLQYVVKVRKRVGWALVLYGVEGTGKTLLTDLLIAMIGHNNASVITGLALHDKFNGWAEHRLLTVVEEVGGFNRRERFDTMNALKPIITNDRITVRRMRTEPYETENTTNLILTTNKAEAFDVSRDGGETRLWFPRIGFSTQAEVEAFKRENPDFYGRLADAIHMHAGAIKGWLLEQPYHPDFKPGERAPASAVKKELAERSKSEERLLIEEILADAPKPWLSSDLLRVDALVEEFGERDPTLAIPHDRWLSTHLRELGFERLGRVRVGEGGREAERAVFWSRNPRAFTRSDGSPDREAIELACGEDTEPL